MPRLLHLASSLGPTSHGKQLSLLVPALQQLGCESRIINLGESEPFASLLPGVRVDSHRMRSWFDPRAWMEIRRHLQSEPWDAICSWGECSTLFAFVAKKARLLNKIDAKWIAIPDLCSGLPLRSRMERFASSAADRVIVHSCRAHEPAFRDIFTSERCKSLPLAVARPDGHRSREEILRAIGLPLGSRFVVAAGNFDQSSNLIAAVWAFDVMRYPFQNLHLVMVGEGPLRPRIEGLSLSLAPEDHRVHYLGLRRDLPELMKHAEQVWVTHSRGGCNLVLEAQAAGKPVISFENADLDMFLPGYPRARRGDVAMFATLARTQMDSPKSAIDLLGEQSSVSEVADRFMQIVT